MTQIAQKLKKITPLHTHIFFLCEHDHQSLIYECTKKFKKQKIFNCVSGH